MKIKYFFTVAGCLLLLAGCKKFLDKKPVSSFVEEEYYKTTAEVETGVFGAYGSLRNVYNLDYILAGLRSDDSYISESEGDINQIDGFSERTTNSYVASYWQQAYFTIKQCNTVLKYIDNVTDPTKKNYFEGEAKFIRAHMYFNLVRLWGDVPLVLKSVTYTDTASQRRIDKNIVYDSIAADFQAAINKLPASWPAAEQGRVTIGAAKGMLAKVYLTQGKYAQSKVLLQDLLTTPGQYQLLPNYKNIFGTGNENNAEIMYSVRFKAASNGLGNTFTYNLNNEPGSVGYRSASDLRSTSSSGVFVPADSIRRYTTFVTVSSTNSSGGISISWYNAGKYLDPGSPRNDGGADFIVLRYADIILMYAEVENELSTTALVAGDATNTSSRLYQLNRIRTRANPAATTLVYAYNSTTINTKDKFRTAVQNERRREFAIEDHRWYDLLRYGTAVTVMNTHFSGRAINTVVQPYQLLYPIPQRERDVTNGILTQNPGY